MIQRVQTIFLLIALIMGITLCFMPIASISLLSSEMTLTIFGLDSSPKWYLTLLFAPGIMIIAIQILMFKNRIKQIKLGLLGILSWIIWASTLAVVTNYVILKNIDYSEINFQYGAVFPLVIILFIRMANRAIKKDEDLVRSIDRIR